MKSVNPFVFFIAFILFTSTSAMAAIPSAFLCAIGRPEEMVQLTVKTEANKTASIVGKTGVYGDSEFNQFLDEKTAIIPANLTSTSIRFASNNFHAIQNFVFPSVQITIYELNADQKSNGVDYACGVHYTVSEQFKNEFHQKNPTSILWQDQTSFGYSL